MSYLDDMNPLLQPSVFVLFGVLFFINFVSLWCMNMVSLGDFNESVAFLVVLHSLFVLLMVFLHMSPFDITLVLCIAGILVLVVKCSTTPRNLKQISSH